ncbi:GPI mannosyltransferase 4 [Xenopus laevis]|uniref:Mannosyltransferase n=1 Tax=Xenopus laevis TaxID=8355 RepID=A0A8J1KPG5_XENLA|nr:GPI mannosyltransferase 4 [Xenopus laevis]XP_041419204.1 GPI mannosyltransferase 4 [Xenopus laevis]XP_041419205.1 GPI mannosyltransferase 4 [Xenopus laevis]
MEAKVLWGALSLLRIFWSLLPQKGYIHPDEFFQSPEVMAGDFLDLETNRPWEFLPTFPCRTILIPVLTSGTAFWIIRVLRPIGAERVLSHSYVLIVLPRIIVTILSFLLDYSVYHIAPAWRSDRWKAMTLLATSYVTLVFYTRTTSNAIEGILFALILLLTSPGSHGCPNHYKVKSSHLIGIVLAAGIFNRPTFLGFAFMPVLNWARKHYNSQFSFKTALSNIFQLLPSFVITASIFIAADTLYYRGYHLYSLSGTEAFSKHILENIVLTPLNFLRYNLSPDNLAQHGTHPPVTHLAVNGVMLFGVLHVSAVFSGIKIMKWFIYTSLYRNKSKCDESVTKQSVSLFTFYFVPLLLLSLFRHQEPRFLIPLLLPLVLLSTQCKRNIGMTSGIVIFNIIGALFFGSLHQAGVVPSLAHVQQTVQSEYPSNNLTTHYTIIFTHTYMPPKHLLYLQTGQNLVNIIDLAGFDKDQLCPKLTEIKRDLLHRSIHLSGQMKHHFLVVIPGTIAPVLDNCELVLKKRTSFFPHLSMEDPPTLSNLFSSNLTTQLALHLIEVNLYT